MRELIAVNNNTSLVQIDDGWAARAEIVIVTSEPAYHLDEDLDLKIRRRECESFRFLANEDQVSTLIEGLEKLRFELQNAGTAVNNANAEWKKAA